MLIAHFSGKFKMPKQKFKEKTSVVWSNLFNYMFDVAVTLHFMLYNINFGMTI